MAATDSPRRQLAVARSAVRALAQDVPEPVAAAVFNFIRGDLVDRPRTVGRPLGCELSGRWSARRGEYRVLYRIDDSDRTVTVIHVEHRRPGQAERAEDYYRHRDDDDRWGDPIEVRGPEPPPFQPNKDLIGYIEKGQRSLARPTPPSKKR